MNCLVSFALLALLLGGCQAQGPGFISKATDPHDRIEVRGEHKVLKTAITTNDPLKIRLVELNSKNRGANGRQQDFYVNFARVPRATADVTATIHNSDPIFELDSGYAYFYGRGPCGKTKRVRAVGYGTEFYLWIDVTNPAQPIHRVINVSNSSKETVEIYCPSDASGALVHTLDPGEHCAFAADNNCNFTTGVNTDAVIHDFLKSVGPAGP